ncbi:Rrf2 family transcriptional regulator [Mycobacterium sp. KBS0706]|uniref:Rrf2 family transcriptional regulator n=1 Tax=Mycobacterium sp. KBS0706 TaxID=2578109 RepID=UPI00110F8EAE|nr:Rrf2 family transcriptional regulator [Mycobacterium sp. KBS0706]TSD87054.1 Rrf2 family transcriptional regulator [Mycobacterium sp. KBS0706]
MKHSERLSAALHVLVHMAERPDAALTSAEMAAFVGTNPVVIRRGFAGLRQAGIVTSVKGHGGGWRLARPAEAVTLAEIQHALGERVVSLTAFEVGQPTCLILRAVTAALDEAMQDAERALDRRLATLTLADLAADARRLNGGRGLPYGDSHHGS